MKNLVLYSLIFCAAHTFAQAGVTKMEVPSIALGEKQDFRVINFEALPDGKFSILYMQDLPATVVNDKEFRSARVPGAFLDKETRRSVAYSDRVIVLVRQTIGSNIDPTNNYWVVAIRELQSATKYNMYYPNNFVHPIIKDGIEVTYSLKNLDQIKGLTPTESDALTLTGKRLYGFYDYPKPTGTYRESTLTENIELLKSGFKELKAVFGKGNIPKEEKVLFKREVIEKIRLTATKVEKKDSVEIKLYMSSDNDGNYELIKSQTYFGNVNPGFATTLVYDEALKVSGAFGYVLLKYKDANGESKANPIALGIDENGEPQFWKLEAGKNTLNSFIPWFSSVDKNGILVISRNQEKIFKPYYQHHWLKKDGTTQLLYPATAAETGTEKFEYTYTNQEKKPVNTGAPTYSAIGQEDFPIAVYDVKSSRYIFMGIKKVSNDGTTTTTTYNSISVMRLDGNNNIKELYDLVEYQGTSAAYPRVLGQYDDKTYLLVNYPNKFELVLTENKLEVAALDNATTRLVYPASNDCVATNQFGSMLLTKSIIGNKYTMEFFPAK